ncbi:Retrovirus-related Pol polyprotein [Oopsacas minuta]|uniref:Retrovirus-related Pol polyprotein n=1 Tax=Oopsacas minuta TaxID=111878 RepID=A0AAV7JDR3_9METZ|nr:Retrovirus-related Pol polyprotein [Oopsacas minuta]
MLYSNNTSVQSSIRTTPYGLIYGRESGLSIEEDKEYGFDTQTYEARLKQRLCKYRSLVADQLADASRYQKRCYDKHATRNIEFKVGENVWLNVPYKEFVRDMFDQADISDIENIVVQETENADEDHNSLELDTTIELESEGDEVHDTDPALLPRRPTRISRIPTHLKDYHLY